MRISNHESVLILSIIHAALGKDAGIWLFGSRADDTQKGGDVDLYVETQNRISAVVKSSLKGRIIDAIERNVDLIINDNTRDMPIFSVAKRTGIKLQ